VSLAHDKLMFFPTSLVTRLTYANIAACGKYSNVRFDIEDRSRSTALETTFDFE